MAAYFREKESEKQAIETVMEGDDESDRPLSPINIERMAPSASPQDMFRTNATTYVVLGLSCLNLAHEAWSYGSTEDIRACRGLILETLVDDGTAITSLNLGYNFLTSIGPSLPNEGDSTSHLRTTLHVIGNLTSLRTFTVIGLPGSPETINTRVLLESLATFRNDLENLELTNIEFRSNSEVQLLADLLNTRGRELTELYFEVLIPVINDDMAGFLDPILLAITSYSGASYLFPSYFGLSAVDGVSVSGVTLISEAALCRILPCVSFNVGNKRALYLKGLGLGDNHVKLIAELMPIGNTQALQGTSASLSLYLESNPAIGLPGYEALLGMLNGGSAIEHIGVDDAGWTATYKMVADMNLKYGRGEFMEGGVFPDKVSWMDWVIRLANVAPAEEMEEEEEEEEGKEEDEKQDFETCKLNYIWYTLLEKPDFISK
jgi:hypothetical protein